MTDRAGGQSPEAIVVSSQIELPYRYALGRWYGAFVTYLEQGRLAGSRCDACGKVAVPARAACPICSAASSGLVEVGPSGTVISAVTDHRDGDRRGWLVVQPQGADTTLLAEGEAAIGDTVVVEAGPTPRFRKA